MAQDRAERTDRQQRRQRRSLVALLLVILLSVPLLVVGGFDLTTRTMFVRMETESSVGRRLEERYDAFQHGYASGVMAVLFGDAIASAAGHAVELVEQDICIEREHDLINNREGRAMARRIHDEDPENWRRRFAQALYDDLRHPDTRFSILRHKDARVAAACRSD